MKKANRHFIFFKIYFNVFAKSLHTKHDVWDSVYDNIDLTFVRGTLILFRVKFSINLIIDMAIYVYLKCRRNWKTHFFVSLRVVSEVSWKTTKSEGKQCCLMPARHRLGWALITFSHQWNL